MQTVRRSTRQRRAMREPDSVYFEELEMSMMTLGFELSAGEKELLLLPEEEGRSCFCKRSKRKHKRRCEDCTAEIHLQACWADSKDKIKRPSKADVQLLVNVLESWEEGHTYKQKINEHGKVVRSFSKHKAVKHADLNTEDSSSHGSSPNSSCGKRDGNEPVLQEQLNLMYDQITYF